MAYRVEPVQIPSIQQPTLEPHESRRSIPLSHQCPIQHAQLKQYNQVPLPHDIEPKTP